MMATRKETDPDRFQRITRWMKENALIAAGVYQNSDGDLRVDHRHLHEPPETLIKDQRRWMLNSGAALVCCCYVAALGKVLRDGMPSCDAGRFVAFLAAHMADFCKESDAKDADLRVQFTKPTVEYPGPHVQHLPKCSFSGGNHGTAVLYAVFRCGFVHSFADGNAVWCRAGADEEYWVTTDNGLAVNVDRLAKGFLDGLYDFTSKYTKHSDFYPALTRGKGAPDGHYADEA